MALFLSWSLMIGFALASAADDFFDDDQPAAGAQSCDCGWSNKGRVVDGKETGANEYPSMVALQTATTKQQFCGGTILTPWHIITAAHCTDGKSPSDIIATIGAHNLKKLESSSSQLKLSAIIEHEKYDRSTVNNDIALLVVEKPIKFSKLIGPACLPKGKIDLVGQNVKALGWGHKEANGGGSDVLLEVDLAVVPLATCRKLWSAAGQPDASLPLQSINICTDHPTKDTCQGDSGGPQLWVDPQSSRQTIVSLVSYGYDCGSMLPGVNTEIASFLDWIQTNIQKSKPGTKACSLQ